MDLLAPVKAFDRIQRRHPPLAIPIAVLRNFSDQGAGNAAALMAYYGFFSIFPLLLLFVTILGYVLAGDPSAEHKIVHSTLSQFPIIGSHLGTLHGSGLGLAIGIIGTLWSGLGVTVAAEDAFSRVYAVPRRARPDFLTSRWRGLKLLVVVGVLQIVSTVASGLVSGGLGGAALTVAGIAVSLLLNLGLFWVVFRFLVSDAIPTRDLWPGVIMAAVGWEILQAVGGLYVSHAIKGADETYGTFATVIGLLLWLYLGARIVVYSAEVNVVVKRRLWPRSIMDPPEPADRRARAAMAKMEERDDRETVEVAFHPPEAKRSASIEHPPYAVAPRPAPGERAEAAAPEIAGPDLHTLTFEQVLAAIDERLEQVDIEQSAKEQAQELLRQLHGQGREDGGAADAIARAAQSALGLADPG